MATRKKVSSKSVPSDVQEADTLTTLTPPPGGAVMPLISFAYTDVRDPVRQGNGIMCEVKFESREDYRSFLATSDDIEPHGRAIYAECEAGKWGDVPDYLPTDAELLAAASERIARELYRADVEVTKYQDRVDIDDATDTDKALLKAWKTYRVGLNRLPELPDYPHPIAWLVAPDVAEIVRQAR